MKHTQKFAIVFVYPHNFGKLGKYIGKQFLWRVVECVHVRDEFRKLVLYYLFRNLDVSRKTLSVVNKYS